MKMLLICPSERAGVHELWRSAPLAAVPLLGQSLLEYWLSALAEAGATEALILSDNRPEAISALAGDGARWGMSVSVIAESRELAPAQALLKYSPEPGPIPAQNAIAVLDHFPGLEQFPLFGSYRDLYLGLREWLPGAMLPDRVGYRQLLPGVWASTCASISPKAKLRGPCWIGHHVSVGAGAAVGPGAIIEDDVILEPGAEVVASRVSSGTFVGSLARITNSITLGNTLINWRSGSTVEVPDPFLLCSLHQPRSMHASWLARLRETYARVKEESPILWKPLVHREG